MENQDIKPQVSNSNPHPKPADDAQSLVETIIPSTEEKASTTTKVEQTDDASETTTAKEKEEGSKKDDVESKENDTKTNASAGKDGHNEGDKIETVAP